MRRILIDTTRLLYRRLRGTLPTGIDRVSLRYIERYRAGARAVVNLGPFSAMLSLADSQAVFDAVARDAIPAGLAVRVLAKSFLWRWLVPARRTDVLFNTGHTGLENMHYAALLRATGARLVVMIHDLIPITHPAHVRRSDSARHRTRMRCAALRATAVIANSRHTLGDFERFAASQGVHAPESVVALLGAGLAAEPAGLRPMEPPYFLMLATLERRKNHDLLLDIWSHAEPGFPHLVLIGQPGSVPEFSARLIERCRSLRDRVAYIPRCRDNELAAWMDHALAVLLPSLTEGFGLPILEALSRGVPVIASDVPALREVGGGIPEYADPRDAPRWEALLRGYGSEGSAARAAQRARMRGFRAPDWDTHFAAIDRLLERIDSPAFTQARSTAARP